MNSAHIVVGYSTADGCYIATMVDEPSVVAHGDTIEEAIKEFLVSYRLYLETLAKPKEVTFSGPELDLIAKALDCYSRVEMGRVDQVMDDVTLNGRRYDGRGLDPRETEMARKLISDATRIITGIEHGGPGINSPVLPEVARTARNLIKKIKD